MKKYFLLIALFLTLNVNTILSDDNIADDVEVVENVDVVDVVEVLEEDTTDTNTDPDDDENIFEFSDFEMEIEIVEEEDDVFETFPQLVEFIDADYPQELQDEGIRGNVLLDVIVSETGTVDSVSIARSLHPVLDTSAMNAVRQFTFTPAKLKTGEYVAVMLQYEYRFHFEDVIVETEVEDTTQIINEIANVDGENIDDDFEADDGALVLDESLSLTVYGREQSTEVAHHRLTIAEVKRIPGLGGEALRVVQAMPGVARQSYGNNDIVVRGLPSWASRYFIDGMSVPILYHLGSNKSSYPSEAVETVDFYPGGFSARYGGATSGIIEMTGRKSNTDSLRGFVDLSFLHGAIFAEGPINERVSFMASARRGFTGDWLSLYFKHFDASGVSMAPYYYDYLVRADIKLNNDHELFVTFMGSWDSVGVLVPNIDIGTEEIGGDLDQANARIDFHTLILGLNSHISDDLKNMLRFSLGYNGANAGLFGVGRLTQTSYQTHLRNQLSYTRSDKLTINVGADIELFNLNLDVALTSGQNIIQRDTVDGGLYGIVGAYTTVEWKATDRLLLVPGIRYDYYPELDYRGSIIPAFWNYGFMNNRSGASGEPAFRMSARYDLMPGHVVKGAVGTYSQSPEPIGIAIHETYGTPDLPATKGAQYVAGYEWQISDLLSLDAQAYLNRLWDVPRSYHPDVDYDPNHVVQRNYFSDGRNRTYGFEFMLRHSRGEKFFGWISYAHSRSEGWSKLYDTFVLSGSDEPHHLQFLGSWKLRNDWDFGVRARFVSDRPMSPIIGTIEDENTNSIRPIYGERNTLRRDPFFQVDLRADKKIEYERWTLTYYLDLQNVLWPIYQSPEFIRHNYNYTERQIVSTFPIPSFGIRAEF